MKANKRQSGFGLIEVLVAALVFALGIAAVFQLQGKLFQSSSSANARTIAMTLAEERLELFRHAALADGGFDDMQAGVGADAPVEIGNTEFTRTWVVTDYYYDASDGDLCSPFPQGKDAGGDDCTEATGLVPEHKTVRVAVSWLDIDQTPSTVELDGLIGRGTEASAAGILAGDPDGGDSSSPTVPYTPSIDPKVTPIVVGDETKRETLVPSTSTVDGFAQTAFVANTYRPNPDPESTGEFELLRQEEFTTVACGCRFDGTSADTEGERSYAASHAVWDEKSGSYKDVRGEQVDDKVKGCVQGGGSNCKTNPDPLCEICCRDHHDKTGVSREYDPYRGGFPDGFDNGGNHEHHLGAETVVTSGEYLESCRMKRVDGFWRVYQDWHLIDLTVLPLVDLVNTDIRDAYASYVKELVSAYIDAGIVDGSGIPSKLPTKEDVPAYDTGDQYVELASGAKSELVARAVYLDYIDPKHLEEVKKLKADGEDFLSHVPFYEVDITPIVAWSSDVPAALRVGPYDGPGSASDLIAGELDALGTNPTAIPVRGDVRQSNSGLVALSEAVDFLASVNPDDQTVSGEVHVCVGCTAGVDPTSCMLPWGGSIANDETVPAFAYEFGTEAECLLTEPRTCDSGTLSGTYQYEGCTEGPPPPPPPATCETTVTGKNKQNDTISIAVFNEADTVAAGPWDCNVTKTKYTCNPVTSLVDAIIGVTRTTSTDVVDGPIVSGTCGPQTVDFN